MVIVKSMFEIGLLALTEQVLQQMLGQLQSLAALPCPQKHTVHPAFATQDLVQPPKTFFVGLPQEQRQPLIQMLTV